MNKFNYKPESNLEKFGEKVYSALVENFSQTFFVGGMVRDLLLQRSISDIDIATEAKPEQIIKILSSLGIIVVDENKRYGSITAKQGNLEAEITTFRKDLKSEDRYPEVKFVNNAREDSKRRDFSINSLYLSLKTNTILDFNKGLVDVKKRLIKFIGQPGKRIQQDPLRIIRALRLALILNFKLENNTKVAIKNNFLLINNLTKSKIKKEINKIKLPKQKNIIKKVINSPKLLDKYFK